MTTMGGAGKTSMKIVERKVRASVSGPVPADRRVADMAKIESKDEVRRKVRETQAQANRERLQRESANRENMVAFLVAEQKLAAVDEWEAERHEHVRLEADQRREEQRLEGARALARMRGRGETVAGIVALGARTEDRPRLSAQGAQGEYRNRRRERCAAYRGSSRSARRRHRFASTRFRRREQCAASQHCQRRLVTFNDMDLGLRAAKSPAAPLWVDPNVHSAEVARFRGYVVEGPRDEDCSIWVGGIGADGYPRN